jgi:Integrase core domain
MSRKGNCLDNAPMESFFASLKKEQVHHVRFRTRKEARAAVSDYVKIFYNRQSLHSAPGYRTPPRHGPAWKGSLCAKPHNVLIPPLHYPRGKSTRITGGTRKGMNRL